MDELAERRGRHFLKNLRDNPFVAVVFEGGRYRVYVKAADPELVSQLEALLNAQTA